MKRYTSPRIKVRDVVVSKAILLNGSPEEEADPEGGTTDDTEPGDGGNARFRRSWGNLWGED